MAPFPLRLPSHPSGGAEDYDSDFDLLAADETFSMSQPSNSTMQPGVRGLGGVSGKVGAMARRTGNDNDNDGWDQDVDFKEGLTGQRGGRGHGKRMAKEMSVRISNNYQPGSMDMGMGDDGIDFEGDGEEKEATIKPGNKVTMKTIMDFGGNTIKGAPNRPNLSTSSFHQHNSRLVEEDDFESAFVLPVTLSNLNLANRSHDDQHQRSNHRSTPLRHKTSRSSFISDSNTTSSHSQSVNSFSSDWDSPTTASKKKQQDRFANFALDRSMAHPSLSTSATSVTSSSMPVTDNSELEEDRGHRLHVDVMSTSGEEGEEGEDMERDLILPSATFFSSGRIHELNRLLDAKRKPSPAMSPSKPVHSHPSLKSGGSRQASLTFAKPTVSSAAKSSSRYDPRDYDMEDGLVLDMGGVELNTSRLNKLRRGRGGSAASGGFVSRTRVTIDEGGSASPPGSQLFVPQSNTGSGLPVPGVGGRRVSSGSGSEQSRIQSHPKSNPSSAATGQLQPPKTPSKLRHQAAGVVSASPGLNRKQSMPMFKLAGANTNAGAHAQYPSGPNSGSIGRMNKMISDESVDVLVSGGGSLGRHQARALDSFAPTSEWMGSSRLLRPTASSSAKIRSALPHHVSSYSSPPSSFDAHCPRPRSISPISGSGNLGMPQLVKIPKGGLTYGNGSELDAIEDLADESPVKSRVAGRADLSAYLPTASISRREPSAGDKRKKDANPTSAYPGKKPVPSNKTRKPAMLIRPLGRVEKKTIGDMTWNPKTLRWEGNYDVLRDFDSQPPARPALISHYNLSTGIGSPAHRNGTTVLVPVPVHDVAMTAKALAATSTPSSSAGSKVSVGGGGGGTAQVIGNMLFDPVKMCWISTLSPEETEPDPFAELEDDAEDGFGADNDGDNDGRGGTITKSMGQVLAASLSAAKTSGLNAPGSITRGNGLRRLISDSGHSVTTTTSSSRFSEGPYTTYSSRGDDDDDGDVDFDADFDFDSENPLRTVGSRHQPHLGVSSDPTLRRQASLTMSLRSGGGGGGDLTRTIHEGPSAFYLDDALVQETWAADKRHREETKGWWFPYAALKTTGRVGSLLSGADVGGETSDKVREREAERKRKEEKRLWEIRNLAMRS